jgi:hypothetical protein
MEELNKLIEGLSNNNIEEIYLSGKIIINLIIIKISIKEINITCIGCKYINEIIKNNNNLKILNLSSKYYYFKIKDNHFSDEGIKNMSNGLSFSTSVKKLYIYGKKI